MTLTRVSRGWAGMPTSRCGGRRIDLMFWGGGMAARLPGTRRCAVVVASRLQEPGLAPLAVVSHRRYLIGLGPSDSVVVHANAACREVDVPSLDPSPK